MLLEIIYNINPIKKSIMQVMEKHNLNLVILHCYLISSGFKLLYQFAILMAQ